MIKYFKDDSHWDTRALQIWQILISLAHNRQIITYEGLDEIVKLGGTGVYAQTLGHIMHYCAQNDLPPLTSLVVNKSTGVSGEGLTVSELLSKREDVYEFDWYGIFPPFINELKKAFEDGNAQ